MSKLRLINLISLGLLLIVISCGATSADRPVSGSGPVSESPKNQAGSNEERPPLKLPLRDPKILIRKGQRQLLLFSDDKLVRRYRIGLGSSPAGDKVRAGDRRTPEGDFYIFTKNAQSAFYLSLGVSYPNAAHAERGLRDGLITRVQYDAIRRALRAKKTPPQNTRLGGDIYIHGNGAGSDWTWGCAALENEDIRELFTVVNVGTPVRIEP